MAEECDSNVVQQGPRTQGEQGEVRTGALPRAVLMALTNIDHYEGSGRPTGIWLEEATSFYDVLTQAGYRVDFASDKGGAVPIDPASEASADARTLEVMRMPDFRERALRSSQRLSDVDPARYAAIYYAGGHGAMWDFPASESLREVSEGIYRAGGYISSVCHGEAGLVTLRDEAGEPLVRGKRVNGFTDEEEALNGTADQVPFSPEQKLRSQGADFVKGAPYTEFAVVDHRFVTGQNPMSSAKVARLLVECLEAGPRGERA